MSGQGTLLLFVLLLVSVRNADFQCAELQKYMELSQACDFYFDGYHHLPPILELKNNGSLTPSISTRDGMRVLRIGEIARCEVYVAASFAFSGVGGSGDCLSQFRINKNNQVEAHFGQQQGAVVDPLQASAIILFLDQLELEDGTCLTDGDRDTKYVESRRCVSFLAMPHLHAEVAAPAVFIREFMVFREKIMLEFVQTMRKIQMNLRQMIQDLVLQQLPLF